MPRVIWRTLLWRTRWPAGQPRERGGLTQGNSINTIKHNLSTKLASYFAILGLRLEWGLLPGPLHRDPRREDLKMLRKDWRLVLKIKNCTESKLLYPSLCNKFWKTKVKQSSVLILINLESRPYSIPNPIRSELLSTALATNPTKV